MMGHPAGTRLGAGQGRGIWPVLLVLLAAALVPSACVLWFMNAAMQNERLAVKQRLTEVYRLQLENTQRRINARVDEISATMDAAASQAAPEAFVHLAAAAPLDGLVILNDRMEVVYPKGLKTSPDGTLPLGESLAASADWQKAEALEGIDLTSAAGAYKAIAAGDDLRARALALQAQARCLERAGDHSGALQVLGHLARDPALASALDAHGRVIAADATLRLLQLLPQGEPRSATAARLERLVNDYATARPLPSAQRVFLMHELMDAAPSRPNLPTLSAEELSAEQASNVADLEMLGVLHPGGPEMRSPPVLRPTQPGKDDVWCLSSGKGRIVGLLRNSRVEGLIRDALPPRSELPGAFVAYNPTHDKASFLSIPLRSIYAGELSLSLEGDDPFALAAAKQNTLYLFTGGAGIAFIALLAVAMASYLGRQMRLTRLKNDLIATVSHELKTPLASMRVLVDTLREGRCTDAKQAGEYFELIARENERLSRLIDNFLTFSRMERNKRAFEFDPVDVVEPVQIAVAAVRDRFSSPVSRLELDVPAGLPLVLADRDALVTVILNLLDNAWKYSGDEKTVRIRAYAADSSVCVEVSDNGVGLSRRAMRRIFDRFYQVDQTLSRKAGGCGLGLSIVKFILDAHGGSIAVKGQVGKGSTFTVSLPAGPGRAGE